MIGVIFSPSPPPPLLPPTNHTQAFRPLFCKKKVNLPLGTKQTRLCSVSHAPAASGRDGASRHLRPPHPWASRSICQMPSGAGVSFGFFPLKLKYFNKKEYVCVCVDVNVASCTITTNVARVFFLLSWGKKRLCFWCTIIWLRRCWGKKTRRAMWAASLGLPTDCRKVVEVELSSGRCRGSTEVKGEGGLVGNFFLLESNFSVKYL